MAEKNVLSRIPTQQMPERRGNFLSRMADEAIGAFERYGRRSGAQRDASLAMLNQAVDPNTDPLTGAGMKALGLAGLVTHPLAFFPTREEWDQRLEAAGNTGRMSRSIGGFLSDLPSLIDPQMAAGGAATVAPAIFAGMMAKTADLNKLKQAEKLAELGHSADDILDMTGWFKGADDKWRFEIPDHASSMKKSAGDIHTFGDATEEVLSHDELYKAYPRLSTMLTKKMSGAGGGFNPENPQMALGRDQVMSDQRRTMLHELQHAVQNIEGFAPGGDRRWYDEALQSGTLPEETMMKIDPNAKHGPAWDAYFRNAGEVEAGNVETRADMLPSELKEFAPYRTQSIPYEAQIVERPGYRSNQRRDPKKK
jgi:hypothetical protein